MSTTLVSVRCVIILHVFALPSYPQYFPPFFLFPAASILLLLLLFHSTFCCWSVSVFNDYCIASGASQCFQYFRPIFLFPAECFLSSGCYCCVATFAIFFDVKRQPLLFSFLLLPLPHCCYYTVSLLLLLLRHSYFSSCCTKH